MNQLSGGLTLNLKVTPQMFYSFSLNNNMFEICAVEVVCSSSSPLVHEASCDLDDL